MDHPTTLADSLVSPEELKLMRDEMHLVVGSSNASLAETLTAEDYDRADHDQNHDRIGGDNVRKLGSSATLADNAALVTPEELAKIRADGTMSIIVGSSLAPIAATLEELEFDRADHDQNHDRHDKVHYAG